MALQKNYENLQTGVTITNAYHRITGVNISLSTVGNSLPPLDEDSISANIEVSIYNSSTDRLNNKEAVIRKSFGLSGGEVGTLVTEITGGDLNTQYLVDLIKANSYEYLKTTSEYSSETVDV